MITCPWEYLARIPALGQPLTCLKGVGPKRARLLAEKNIHTILDLFYCIPLRYEDRTRLLPIGSAKGSEAVLVCGTVVTAREAFFPRSRKRLFRVVIEDGSGRLSLIWFHYRKQHLAGLALKGTSLLVYGQLQENGAEKQLIHPEIIPHTPGREKDSLHINPVYPIIEGISRRTLRSMVLAALTLYGKDIVDPLPASIREPRRLLNLRSSFQEIHLPPPESSVERLNLLRTQGHRRLRFDVACKVMLNLAFRKAAGKRWTIPPLSADPHLKARLREILPFSLTPGQHAAVRDILRDFTAGHPMSRLIQGDVGCGKTIVAAVAAFIAVSHKKQVAFMVPTQVLAVQHWSFFHDFHAGAGFKPALLTGGLLPSDLKKLRGEIEAGRVNVIIGTHALIQESVTFHDLGLAIIDEQHRFGVRQRALLDRKGNHPHMLVLSATPIPRTLGMTVYGDMDISTIRDLPKGRLPVVTRLVERDRKGAVFQFLKKRLRSRQQALVICPYIDGTEDEDMKNAKEMGEKLRELLSPPFRVQVMHGSLPGPMREQIMHDFRDGRIDLLVSTTVIEVGVHVPNATVMIIEQPERFGLAQLHQLRGRIGRGSIQGVCILMVAQDIPRKARKRLEFLARTNDGFEIARKDLEMRGHGETFGMKQAGMGERDLLEGFGDPDLLTAAREEADRIVREDPTFRKPDHQPLQSLLEPEWSDPLER